MKEKHKEKLKSASTKKSHQHISYQSIPLWLLKVHVINHSDTIFFNLVDQFYNIQDDFLHACY